MTHARTLAISLSGLEGTMVEVEADVTAGLPAFTVVGLPDSSTLQSRDRVRSAAAGLGMSLVQRRITVNLQPAWRSKHGSGFDLPIAVAVLAAQGGIAPDGPATVLHLGELGLDGRLRPIPGVLPALLAAREHGVDRAVVPIENMDEARLVDGIDVMGAAHLAEVLVQWGADVSLPHDAMQPMIPPPDDEPEHSPPAERIDFADVIGQRDARHAAEIAAAGGHHLLMTGPPGAGKSLIASRLPTILPPLNEHEALEVSAIASLTGRFRADDGLIRTPPFERPHHTASTAAIVGGGAGTARPGAISRAHAGVLFLDESCNGKCTSFSKEVTDGNEHEHDGASSRPERAARTSYAVGGIPGVHPDWTGRAVAGNEADLPVLAAVEVPQGQGRCDRAAAA